MKNKVINIIAVISILLNIGLIYMFVFKGETVKSNDNRVAMLMSSDNKDFVLAEMRGFLESVQKINEGILENDSAKIINAGTKSGGSVTNDAPKGLMKSLPIGFKQLGFSTHDLFDKIAKNAKENFKPKEAQKQLNNLLYKCVSCHSAYKIETLNKE